MPIKKLTEGSTNLSNDHCPECGEVIKAQVKTYLLECDRCLSKRDEQNIKNYIKIGGINYAN